MPCCKCWTDKALQKDLLQVAISLVLSFALPLAVYIALDAVGVEVTGVVYFIVIAFLLFVALTILVECVCALFHERTVPKKAGAPEPFASAIICAYLPNEAPIIMDTVESFFKLDYKPGVQIILAYNTPNKLPVEDELAKLALKHDNLELLRVENSRSKAQNLNAALEFVRGDFVACFDADHQPDPDSFSRAWRWLSNGYDVVQGHCLVRNAEETWLAKMVAVEFESIYAVAHPGRTVRDGFGIFGGSNGYWKSPLLKKIGMLGEMLTEDIDSSMRTLESGGKIASDPGLISRELATTTARQLWNQRLRWAQGWTQVSMKHFIPLLRNKHFGLRQKLGAVMLLLVREIYPWISSQMLPLIAFWYIRGDDVAWNILVFLILSSFTACIGPGTVVISYRLSHPLVKNWWWFVQYGIFSMLLYTEIKNIIGRVGHVKQFLFQESSWRVTPRSANAEISDTGAPTLKEYQKEASVRELDVVIMGSSKSIKSMELLVRSKDNLSFHEGSSSRVRLHVSSDDLFSITEEAEKQHDAEKAAEARLKTLDEEQSMHYSRHGGIKRQQDEFNEFLDEGNAPSRSVLRANNVSSSSTFASGMRGDIESGTPITSAGISEEEIVQGKPTKSDVARRFM